MGGGSRHVQAVPMPYFDSVSVRDENVCHVQWHPPGKMTLNFLPAEPTDLCQGPIVISNEHSSHILAARN